MAGEQEQGALLSGIADMFSSSPSATVIPISSEPSNGSSAKPLSAESERLLGSVPDSISDGLPGADGPEASGASEADDAIAALMAQVAFEPQDVQDVVAETFEWLAEHFKSDHWKLTERQARMLGRPTAQLLNSLWARLSAYIPDILARWCEETPGATAFLLACGLVVGPKIAQQISISRQRAKERPIVQPIRVQPAPQPTATGRPAPPNGGIVFEG